MENGKWIYHLSSIDNLSSILSSGLLSRRGLIGQKHHFQDIADREILQGREAYGLDAFVPFHFFSGNPFDGRVQKTRSTEKFFYICINRTLAQHRGYKILPAHPLARTKPTIYDYQEGFSLIDWEKMNSRDYSDSETKLICMAECLSPISVPRADFDKLIFRTDEDERNAQKIAKSLGVTIPTWVNENFFIRS